MLCQPLPSRFLEFLGSVGAIVGEVAVLDFWAVDHIGWSITFSRVEEINGKRQWSFQLRKANSWR
jgi:hypothetical protein